MYKNGLFVGKFLPPHIGHKWAILDAKNQCKKLIVLVCYEPQITERECSLVGIPNLTLQQKYEWWCEELAGIDGIEIKKLDETGFPPFPNGWLVWSQAVNNTIGEPIDAIFGSEENYREGYAEFFPNAKYIVQDSARENVKISSTMIRKNLDKYINFVIPSAKKYFSNFLQKKF